MSYNKDNKKHCDICNKAVNVKYFNKHCEQKRHLRLKAEKEGNNQNNMVNEIKEFVNRLGIDNVKNIVDMMFVARFVEKQKTPEPVAVIDVGKDVWDIIDSYKEDLDINDKHKKVMEQLLFKHKYRDVRYLWEICFGEECFEASKYINNIIVNRHIIEYDFDVFEGTKQYEFLRFGEPRNIKYIVEGVEYLFNQKELTSYKNKRDRRNKIKNKKIISIKDIVAFNRERVNPYASRSLV